MKIILKNCEIELTVQEFKKLFSGKNKKSERKKLTESKKKLIKKIVTMYPDRSDRSIAKELELSRDSVRYWREHLDQI